MNTPSTAVLEQKDVETPPSHADERLSRAEFYNL